MTSWPQHTVEHFNIAALKKCDPETIALIATLKKSDLAHPKCLVLGDPHLICCNLLENGQILKI